MNVEHLEGLDELFNYKNQIMDDLLSSETVVSLLSNDLVPVSKADSLMYSQVFPYEFIPSVTEHGQTFICCEVDIEVVPNKTFLNPLIYMWVFTHKSLLRLPDEQGLRIDRLSSEIVSIMNGSRRYGLGTLNIQSARRFSPITDYQGRLIRFYTTDFNRVHAMSKQVPASRRGY